MKLLITELAIFLLQASFPDARATQEPNRAGYSRTLYTSMAPEQSNIIFK
jgi:hypothetical protein